MTRRFGWLWVLALCCGLGCGGRRASCPRGSVTEEGRCVEPSSVEADASVDVDAGAPEDACVPEDETCNGVDDDCDDLVDEGALSTFYRDADGDGFGDDAMTVEGCSAPDGYAAQAGDCDDGCAECNPAAAEVCDGVDNDCDGTADEADAVDAPSWYIDCDDDGFSPNYTYTHRACSAEPRLGCTFTTTEPADGATTDCDDGNDAVFPGQTAWFTAALAGRTGPAAYDYDCSGAAEKELGAVLTSCPSSCPSGTGGWTTTVPPCGYGAAWRSCGAVGAGCVDLGTDTRVQRCH